MSTIEEKNGQTLTVTYRIEEGISNQQAREMIANNTPSGFNVEDVKLENEQGS